MYLSQVYQRLEKGNNCEYWEDITVIVKDELHKLRKRDRRTGKMDKRTDGQVRWTNGLVR